MEKICWQITVAAFMQPLQYDLRSPAAKDNSITHAATAWSKLDAAIIMWVAKHNRNTRNGVGNCSFKTGSQRQSEKNNILNFEALFKRIFRRKFTSAKMEKKTHFVRDFLQNSIGNSSTSTTCNPIYIAGTILQLQITMEFCRPHMHEKHLKPHLQCGTDPTMIRPWSETWSEHDPTTHETVSHPSHRRGRSSRFGDGLCMEKHRLSCICYLSKTHFVRDFLQNSIGNSSTSTTCNPIYSEGTILELQITMEFHRQLIHQHHLQPHLHCGNDPTVANHNGILSTAHARKTLETPFTMRNRSDHGPRMIRAWSENDPTTHETVSQPSHRRRRSSRFGDGLCMEKHRLSCICYLSKTHFVRDFHQNSIGNSSTSTTCNPIYIAGTILELQITMEFHRQLDPPACTRNPIYTAGTILQLRITMEFCRTRMHETQVTPHLQCGTDPRMIRAWSDHTRDSLATVAPQR